MTLGAFLDITPKEFYHALRDKEKYDTYTVKATISAICDTIRMQTWWLMNIQLPAGKKISNEKNLMLFPWDDEDSKEPQTKEEIIATMKMIAGGHYKNKK